MKKPFIVSKALKLNYLFSFSLALLFSFGSANAQDINSKILAEIGPEKISVGEFLQVYKKNNVQAADLDPRSLEEYLELYINFRLKVLEAEENGLHNQQSFKDELSGYRAQLAKPYLVDEEATERLVKEAHQRLQEDIRASHLLIRVEKQAEPKDTLEAYSKTMGLRERILKGESFADIAEMFSEDQSARDRDAGGRQVRGNKGDLGYFTAFDMVYAFESAAYALQKGAVSMPVRTEFGYHLIYVSDRKPAMGKVVAAHILLLYPAEPTKQDTIALEEKIRMVDAKLKAGENWDDLVRQYSDDRSTADKGGVLQAFGSNRMIPEFIYQISLLSEPDQITQPFHTYFGWHIIKLIEQQKPAPFEEAYAELKDRVQKNERSVVIKQSLVNRIKKEYGFQESLKAIEPFITSVDSSIFEGTWKIPPKMKLKGDLFTIGAKKYTQKDFADYLVENQRRMTAENIRYFVNESYKKFVEKTLLDYEDHQLENKFPEFKALVREYRDGILLFELTDKKIWSMAVQDTAGLTAYHKAHENNYMWNERADASVFTFNGADVTIVKEARQLAGSGTPDAEILEKINKDEQILNISRKMFQQGDNEFVDAAPWSLGIKDQIVKDGKTVFVVIHELLPPAPKHLNEVRGLVTADFQNHLEKEWIRELREKYRVNVDRQLLSQIR